MALAAISLSGVLTFHEALEGFSEPVIMMIALMFVISEGFYRTGISCRSENGFTQSQGTACQAQWSGLCSQWRCWEA